MLLVFDEGEQFLFTAGFSLQQIVVQKSAFRSVELQHLLGQVYQIPYFCATAAQFYSITQGQAVSNRN